MPFQHLTTN